MSGYWLRADHQTSWDEVSKADYVAAERNAGFHNTLGQPEEPATSAFSGKGMNGRQGFLSPATVDGGQS